MESCLINCGNVGGWGNLWGCNQGSPWGFNTPMPNEIKENTIEHQHLYSGSTNICCPYLILKQSLLKMLLFWELLFTCYNDQIFPKADCMISGLTKGVWNNHRTKRHRLSPYVWADLVKGLVINACYFVVFPLYECHTNAVIKINFCKILQSWTVIPNRTRCFWRNLSLSAECLMNWEIKFQRFVLIMGLTYALNCYFIRWYRGNEFPFKFFILKFSEIVFRDN